MADPRATAMLPRALSTIAPEVDRLYGQLYAVTVLVFLGVVGTLLGFVVLYRRRPGVRARPVRESLALELTWLLAPVAALAYFFHQGAATYLRERIAPPDALEIRVVAKQWSWDFLHPDGRLQTNELIVPIGRPIRLVMSSDDVIHGFSVPELRIKQDVVPGMFTTLWFEIPLPSGDHPLTLFCTEYCGAPAGITAPAERADGHMIDNQNSNHATMLARIHAVAPEQYADFGVCRIGDLACEGAPDPEACWGQRLYRSTGCSGCHSIETRANDPAPPWSGIWGRVRAFEDGTTAIGDANYIRQSILEPQAHIVRGFTNVRMPAGRFSDRQLDAIVAYIRSVAPPPEAPAPPTLPRTRSRRRH